jgi:hypothetical protein
MHFAQPSYKLLVVTARYPSYRFGLKWTNHSVPGIPLESQIRMKEVQGVCSMDRTKYKSIWAKTPQQHFCNKLSGMECAHLAVSVKIRCALDHSQHIKKSGIVGSEDQPVQFSV